MESWSKVICSLDLAKICRQVVCRQAIVARFTWRECYRHSPNPENLLSCQSPFTMSLAQKRPFKKKTEKEKKKKKNSTFFDIHPTTSENLHLHRHIRSIPSAFCPPVLLASAAVNLNLNPISSFHQTSSPKHKLKTEVNTSTSRICQTARFNSILFPVDHSGSFPPLTFLMSTPYCPWILSSRRPSWKRRPVPDTPPSLRDAIGPFSIKVSVFCYYSPWISPNSTYFFPTAHLETSALLSFSIFLVKVLMTGSGPGVDFWLDTMSNSVM